MKMTMTMTKEGEALIKRFEGFRGNAYRCPAGVLTIGYGHTAMAGPPMVSEGMKMSEAEASAVLSADVEQFAEGVRHALRREVNDTQFAALVSFAFNVGLGAFRSSSVLKAVNVGEFDAVPRRLQLWVKSRGKVLPGLVNRRAAEAALFMSDPSVTPDAGLAETGRPVPSDGKPPLQSTTVISGIVAGVASVLSGGVGAASGASPVILLLAAAGVAAALWIIRERILKAREDGI